MATSIGQYTPVVLPEEPAPWQRSLAGHILQGHEESDTHRSDPAHIGARLLLPVAALPQWELSVKVVQLLGLQGPWWCQVCRDTDCLHAGVMALSESFFEPLIAGDQKASLAVFLCSSTHSGNLGAPLPGILLCCSVHQAYRGALLCSSVL